MTMPHAWHHDMRTTRTPDDDVAAKFKAESRRAGRLFRDIVNETRRSALASQRAAGRRQPFKVETRDLGDLRPGLSLDNVAGLIEQVEGAAFRGSAS